MELTTKLDRGRIHLVSRLVFPPMATHTSPDGSPAARTVRRYEEIAENPLVGLLITEHHYVDRAGKADPRQGSFASDTVIKPQRDMAAAVHRVSPGVKFFVQISHAGAATSPRFTGEPLVSASDIDMGGGPARALTVEEIYHIEDEFAAAARRVKEAGYDGVEIHCAHGYLLDQFYSPLTNFRDDEYGRDSLENRLRMTVETVKKVRAAVGDTFPIAVRLGGSDYMAGGSTLADAAGAAALLEQAGIDLSGGMNGFTRDDVHTPGWFSDMGAAVKAKVSIPVLVTGGITTPAEAEALLTSAAADLVGVGRALFRNPRWGM